MARLDGIATLKSKGRGTTLTARDPHVEALVRGLDLDSETLALARLAGKNLWRERNRWDLSRRTAGSLAAGGYAGRKLTKVEADRLLRMAVAEVSR